LRVNNYFNINFLGVITFPIKNFKRFEFPSPPSLSVRLKKRFIRNLFVFIYSILSYPSRHILVGGINLTKRGDN